MSFAVIKTGGKQYKVNAGEILKVELLRESKKEEKIVFKDVLAYGDEKSFEIISKRGFVTSLNEYNMRHEVIDKEMQDIKNFIKKLII